MLPIFTARRLNSEVQGRGLPRTLGALNVKITYAEGVTQFVRIVNYVEPFSVNGSSFSLRTSI